MYCPTSDRVSFVRFLRIVFPPYSRMNTHIRKGWAFYSELKKLSQKVLIDFATYTHSNRSLANGAVATRDKLKFSISAFGRWRLIGRPLMKIRRVPSSPLKVASFVLFKIKDKVIIIIICNLWEAFKLIYKSQFSTRNM
jgi:hypothetical protein